MTTRHPILSLPVDRATLRELPLIWDGAASADSVEYPDHADVDLASCPCTLLFNVGDKDKEDVQLRLHVSAGEFDRLARTFPNAVLPRDGWIDVERDGFVLTVIRR